MRTFFMFACAIAFAAHSAAAADNTAAPTVAHVRGVVTLAEESHVSPGEVGIVDKIAVTLGQIVDKDQLLLQLDERKAQRELMMSTAKYAAAKAKADDDINIRYAKASAEVAKKELKYSTDANAKVPFSVPQARLDELELKVKETELAIEKSGHDHTVAEMEAAVAEAEVNAAKVMVDLLKVRAPFDGKVVEIRVHKGEAVQPAEAGAIHIVSLDKLWVKCLVPAKDFARSQLENQPVTVEVEIARGQKATVNGQIDFVNPLNDSGSTYEVRAVIQRAKRDDPWRFSPGMQAEMTIPLRAAETR